MATQPITHYVEKHLGRFPHFLLCMVLEWVLIIVLFLDGFLAFFANEFARHFDLKLPCWLCTRMNHVLASKTRNFYYNDSICEVHKKEVSSLGFCHNHKKLSQIRKMCERCLLSFATERESQMDIYKSLVGVLHKDLECFVDDCQKVQLGWKDDEVMQIEKSSTQSNSCACCGEPFIVKSCFSKRKNSQPKLMPGIDSEIKQKEEGNNAKYPIVKLREAAKDLTLPLLTKAEGLNHMSPRTPTPTFAQGNKFFGTPLTDFHSPNSSPRWSYGIIKKSPLEKTESAASDSNEVNDAVLKNLERQVSLDGKSLMSVYMELEEERSAAAVAANNAMAMITRLQEEKAALQMDASQYQRMMEEQLEYDEEALQESNDMILKLEEEVKALETEVEIYRGKYGGLTEDDFIQTCSSRGSHSSLHRLIEGKDSGEREQAMSYQADNGGGKFNESLKDFKMEKTYLLGRMKKMENRTSMAESGTNSLQFGSDNVNNVDSETGKENEVSLPRQLSFLTERMKALEADNGFLYHFSKEDETHTEGTKILNEISQNLEKLRHLVTLPIEINNA